MSAPEQLTAADLDRLIAGGDYAQIERHRAEGRLTDLLGHVPPISTQPHAEGAPHADDT